MLRTCWLVVLMVNVATLAIYGFDKWRSNGAGRRVPERTLLWWTFAGGWIGAWVAMSMFRHKTVKVPVRRWVVLWTVVNPFWVLAWWTWQAW